MKREITLEEISDGKLYGMNDMVRADCRDCEGCFACCKGMGSSIILDPYDIWNISINLGKKFEELLGTNIELNVSDGLILPNLKMAGGEEQCSFLSEGGRCTIHPFRPGICRLFPLGRYYENQSFRYFLQIHECKNENRTKIKVKKWIGLDDIRGYEDFICRWHFFLLKLQEFAMDCSDSEQVKGMNLYILNHFYIMPIAGDADFFAEVKRRITQAEEDLGLIED